MRVLVRILSFLQSSWFPARFLMRRDRWLAFREERPAPGADQGSSTWFHASSLGELEMARPLIEDLLARGVRVAVSVFSPSALSGLKDLAPRLAYSGFSPREDQWRGIFHDFKVRRLVLIRYDFWPGLALASADAGIPVLVLNARPGSSWKWMARAFLFFGISPPSITFFSGGGTPEELGTLRKWFRGSVGIESVDPRWERVLRRLDAGTRDPRVLKIEESLKTLPKPWVFVASAWMEDLQNLVPVFRRTQGTLVVVPHSLDARGLNQMREFLISNLSDRHLLIAEMGILVDLYPLADRVFVGGGYGKGIHSTIEPAAAFKPVACGPARARRFPEVAELSARGVLRVCEREEAILGWLSSPFLPALDRAWVLQKRERYAGLLEQILSLGIE